MNISSHKVESAGIIYRWTLRFDGNNYFFWTDQPGELPREWLKIGFKVGFLDLIVMNRYDEEFRIYIPFNSQWSISSG